MSWNDDVVRSCCEKMSEAANKAMSALKFVVAKQTVCTCVSLERVC